MNNIYYLIIIMANELMIKYDDTDMEMLNKIKSKYKDISDKLNLDHICGFVLGYKNENDREIETFKRIDDLMEYVKEYETTYKYIIDDKCEKEILKIWPVFIYGQDNEGHPVFYDEIGLADKNLLMTEYNKNKKLFGMFRYKMMKKLYNVKQSQNQKFNLSGDFINNTLNSFTKHCVVINLNNISMMMSTDIGNIIKDIIEIGDIYPDTLEKLYIINAPWSFSFVWKIIKHFVHYRTRDKIEILGTNYIKTITKKINITQIPEKYGGKCKSLIVLGDTNERN